MWMINPKIWGFQQWITTPHDTFVQLGFKQRIKTPYGNIILSITKEGPPYMPISKANQCKIDKITHLYFTSDKTWNVSVVCYHMEANINFYEDKDRNYNTFGKGTDNNNGNSQDEIATYQTLPWKTKAVIYKGNTDPDKVNINFGTIVTPHDTWDKFSLAAKTALQCHHK